MSTYNQPCQSGKVKCIPLLKNEEPTEQESNAEDWDLSYQIHGFPTPMPV